MPATFFLIERHLSPETEPIVQRIAAEGHGVALHSHTRAKLFLDPDELGRRLTAFAHRRDHYRPTGLSGVWRTRERAGNRCSKGCAGSTTR